MFCKFSRRWALLIALTAACSTAAPSAEPTNPETTADVTAGAGSDTSAMGGDGGDTAGLVPDAPGTQGDAANGDGALAADAEVAADAPAASDVGDAGAADGADGGSPGDAADGIGGDALSDAPSDAKSDAKSDVAGDAAVDGAGDAQPDAGSDAVLLAAVCTPCSANASCPTGLDCIGVKNGSFCLNSCGTAADCQKGFSCEKAEATAAFKSCLPPAYTCAGCQVFGCGKGEVCDAVTGACKKLKTICEACASQGDCVAGTKCVLLGSAKVCAPVCDAGNPCAANSTCQLTVAGQVCVPQSAECCYGATCSNACGACPNTCVAGSCVQCVADSNCPGSSCDLASHQCKVTGACPAGKPYKLVSGVCVECTNDAQCALNLNGSSCSLTTNTCGDGTPVGSPCAACGGDTPACVQANGWSCVECITDADCAAKAAGTCIAASYTCTASAKPGPTSGTCKKDSDCANKNGTTFLLKCDAASGLCYDLQGRCDNSAAFCSASAGSVCTPAGPAGLTGLLGSYCTCAPPPSGITNPVCGIFAPTCDCAKNAADPACKVASPLAIDCCAPITGETCLNTTATPSTDCFAGTGCACNLSGGSFCSALSGP